MPTHAEWQELYNNCTWTWDDQKNGYKVIASNGNYIFLPAAGFRLGTSSRYVGFYGNYWASQVHSSGVNYAWRMFFNSGDRLPDYNGNRCNGFSVRPVCP